MEPDFTKQAQQLVSQHPLARAALDSADGTPSKGKEENPRLTFNYNQSSDDAPFQLEDTHHFLGAAGSIHDVHRKKPTTNFNDLINTMSLHPSNKNSHLATDRQIRPPDVISEGLGFLLKPQTGSATDSLEDFSSQQQVVSQRNQRSQASQKQLSASTHLHLSGLSESRQEQDSKQPPSKRNSVLMNAPTSERQASGNLGRGQEEKSSTLSHPQADAKDIEVHGSSTMMDQMLLGDDDDSIVPPDGEINKPNTLSSEGQVFTSKASSRRLRRRAQITTESSQSYQPGQDYTPSSSSNPNSERVDLPPNIHGQRPRLQDILEKQEQMARTAQTKIVESELKNIHKSYKKFLLSKAIQEKSPYLWYYIIKLVHSIDWEKSSKQKKQLHSLLDQFFELHIQKLKIYIGAGEPQGGTAGAFSNDFGLTGSGVKASRYRGLIGYQMLRPSPVVCSLVHDITMYTKFKLIAHTSNGKVPIDAVQDPIQKMEVIALRQLLVTSKDYIIKCLKSNEVQQALALCAFRLRHNRDVNESAHPRGGSSEEGDYDINSMDQNQDFDNEQLVDIDELKRDTLKLVQLLATIGSNLHQMGSSVECEEAYLFYIGTIESLFGADSPFLAECYFWLGYYYKEVFQYAKAEACLLKAKAIEINEKGMMTESVAEAFLNLGQIYKKQLRFQKAVIQVEKAVEIYDGLFGKKSFLYTTCLSELAKLKIIQKRFEEALLILQVCTENYRELFANDKKNKNIRRTKRLIKGVHAATSNQFRGLELKGKKDALKHYRGLFSKEEDQLLLAEFLQAEERVARGGSREGSPRSVASLRSPGHQKKGRRVGREDRIFLPEAVDLDEPNIITGRSKPTPQKSGSRGRSGDRSSRPSAPVSALRRTPVREAVPSTSRASVSPATGRAPARTRQGTSSKERAVITSSREMRLTTSSKPLSSSDSSSILETGQRDRSSREREEQRFFDEPVLTPATQKMLALIDQRT